MRMRLALALGLAAGGLSLSACADDMYGPYGYGGYYGAGYGYGAYDNGYYAGGYAPYGYGYGYGAYDPFGWYDDFYYPGVGVYVYDSYRRPHYWNSTQQSYWSGRRSTWQGRTGSTMSHENWSGFTRGTNGTRYPHH